MMACLCGMSSWMTYLLLDVQDLLSICSHRYSCSDVVLRSRRDLELDSTATNVSFCEDDDEFCLVKRILGKGGNNMRRIAEENNAKIRLRGIGSRFLEGPAKKETLGATAAWFSSSRFSLSLWQKGVIGQCLQDCTTPQGCFDRCQIWNP